MLTSSIRFCKQSIDAIVLLRLLCEWKSYGKKKTLLVLQPRQVSYSLNRYNLTVLCNLLKIVQFARALWPSSNY